MYRYISSTPLTWYPDRSTMPQTRHPDETPFGRTPNLPTNIIPTNIA